IANIFSRVTGSNISNIDGLLSANGAANLFLINPNGIIFGENARLDLGGSFFASTADSLLFEGDAEFSASNPQAPPLLEVSIPIGLNFRDNPGDIVNQGNLAVEQDFTLSGGNLDLQGQLQAGRDLTLQATDTVQIRDSVNNPFIAAANGQLLVQGNQSVDIFALNHLNSGLFSGGDLVLRSANAVSGDAHYWSGGNFKIQQLNGNLGNLSSPNDPIIRSLGDVSFNNYLGNSLHILAGGSVTIPGSIIIIGFDPSDFIAEDITLSDGTLISIDGSVQPTLDIRAGVDNTELENTDITGEGLFFSDVSDPLGSSEIPNIDNSQVTSADITIGDVSIISPDGVVLLTNQYQPNTSLSGGIIEVGSIQTNDTNVLGEFSGNSGSVTIDSRSNFTVTNLIDSSSASGNAGNINILANNAVSLTNEANINSNTFGTGKGGDINVQAKSVSLTNGAELDANTVGQGNGGNVTIRASDFVEVIGISNEGENSVLGTFVDQEATGSGGNLLIETGRLTIQDGSQVQAGTFGEGQGGTLTVIASQLVEVIGTDGDQGPSGLFTATLGSGSSDAGDLAIDTGKLVVKDGAQISSSTFGFSEGNAGNLIVKASESVEVIGTSAEGDEFSSSILSETGRLLSFDNPDAIGEGGSLTIETGKLVVEDGAIISTQAFGTGDAQNLTIMAEQLIIDDAIVSASTNGEGDAGDLIVSASNSVKLNNPGGLFAQVNSGTGKGGDLTIETKKLSINNGAGIGTTTESNLSNSALTETANFSNTSTEKDAGNLTIRASEFVEVNGENSAISSATLSVIDEPDRDGGDLTIETERLNISDGGIIGSSTIGAAGDAGDLFIRASDSITVSAGVISAETQDKSGDGGNLTLETGQVTISNGSQVRAITTGEGQAGSLTINASEFVKLFDTTAQAVNGLLTQTGGSGDGGELQINTSQLIVLGGSQIFAGTLANSQGSGGNLTVNASEFVEVSGTASDSQFPSNLSTATRGFGSAGDLTISTEQLTIQDGAEVSAATFSTGKAGTMTINATDSVKLTGTGGLFVQATNGGTAGDLDVETRDLTIADGASVTVSSPEGQAGNLSIKADSLSQNRGLITAETGISEGDIGANINLEISDTWRIENESLVSATAFGDADGGNININQGLSNTEFLLFAFPPTGTNGSDITANAEQGDGGRIDITAAGVFGIEFREISAEEAESNSLNDFTVTSEFGQSGETIINRTVDDPTSGLINLPASVGDASDRISQNPCEQGIGSEFIITGKGGLPPNPNETLNSDGVRVDLIEPFSKGKLENDERGRRGEENRLGASDIPPENSTQKAVPAMGWVFNDRGEVTLTAYATTDTAIQRSGQHHHNTCSSGISP
ncbi:MAG: filamentous hemagglutinin N-terminal domain-containing protein, partial [Pleurocapsa sp. MO_226.B13]|nr:filamentous hemagglutinin N-terminal domain-containing protein [Pleurocapsa sp. MO_226.B13]